MRVKNNPTLKISLIAGVIISGIAAYISVTGITALFPAGGIIIALMAGSMEVGKIVSVASWKYAKGWYKTLMTFMIPLLMLITAIGVYGFLSDSNQSDIAPSLAATVQIERATAELELAQADVVRGQEQLRRMDAELESMHQRNMLTKEANRRNEQAADRAKIELTIASAVRQQHDLLEQKAAATVATKHAEATPIRFASRAIGLTDEQTTRAFIALLMTAFDPLGLLLVAVGCGEGGKKIGRPVGSKNKAKKRGRPVGSKNVPKGTVKLVA